MQTIQLGQAGHIGEVNGALQAVITQVLPLDVANAVPGGSCKFGA